MMKVDPRAWETSHYRGGAVGWETWSAGARVLRPQAAGAVDEGKPSPRGCQSRHWKTKGLLIAPPVGIMGSQR